MYLEGRVTNDSDCATVGKLRQAMGMAIMVKLGTYGRRSQLGIVLNCGPLGHWCHGVSVAAYVWLQSISCSRKTHSSIVERVYEKVDCWSRSERENWMIGYDDFTYSRQPDMLH